METRQLLLDRITHSDLHSGNREDAEGENSYLCRCPLCNSSILLQACKGTMAVGYPDHGSVYISNTECDL